MAGSDAKTRRTTTNIGMPRHRLIPGHHAVCTTPLRLAPRAVNTRGRTASRSLLRTTPRRLRTEAHLPKRSTTTANASSLLTAASLTTSGASAVPSVGVLTRAGASYSMADISFT